MSRSLGTLTLDLIAKTGGFTAPLDKAGRDADKRFKAMERQAKALGTALGTAITAGAGLAATGLGIYIRNTVEAERVQAQLNAVLKSTKEAAGLSAEQLNSMADSLQRVTVFDDEAITGAQALLLTFTKIGGDVMPRAVETVLDMATAMGGDLKSASLQLGKALNDPIKGVAALGEVGVQFTQDQKKLIESLVETGKVADAQKIILTELETQMGGSARAARDTLGGAFQGLKNTIDNLLEGDGSGGGMVGLREEVNRLNSTLEDRATKQAIDGFAEGLLRIANSAIVGAREVAGFLGDLKATIFGTGAGDLQRQLAEIESLRKKIAQRERDFDPDTPVFGTERLRDRLAKLEAEFQKNQADAFTPDLQRQFRDSLAPLPKIPKLTGTGTGGGETTRAKAAAVKELTEAEKAYQEVMEVNALIDEEVDSFRRQAIATDYQKAEAMDRAREQIDSMIGDMQFELELMGMTNQERAREIALRYAGAEATQEQREQIGALSDALIEGQKAQDQWREFQQSLTDTFVDLASNVGDAKNILRDFFDDLNRMILRSMMEEWAERVTDSLKGMAKNSGGGSGGGINWGAIIGSLFGGGRAAGGAVNPGMFYRVNEAGPEMLSVGGRDYLMMGKAAGQVTPHRAGMAGVTQNVSFMLAAPTDPRTQEQIAERTGYQIREAMRRNG